jgi:hypothetical protein
MLSSALNDELTREPFLGLRLFLADGRTIEILNPGLCFINHGALYAARVDRPGSRIAADLDLISLRHIVSIEHIEPEPPSRDAKQPAA